MNFCPSVWVANSTFDNVSQPVGIRGGSGYHIASLAIVNFTVGVNLTGVSDVLIANLNLSFGVPQLNYSGLSPQGAAIALDGGANLSISGLSTYGNPDVNATEALQVFWVRNVYSLNIASVTVFRPWGLGRIETTTPLTIAGLSGTAFGNGLEVVGCPQVTLLDFALDGNALYGVDLQGSRSATLTNITAVAWRGLHIQNSSNVTLSAIDLTVTQFGLAVLDTPDLAVTGLTVSGTGTGLSLHNVTRGTVDHPALSFDMYG